MPTQTLEHSAHRDGDLAHAGVKHHHVTSPTLLLGVYGALVVFTVITVGVTLVDLGNLNIWVALLIAVIKAVLVGLYFMHLRWDNPFNGAILVMSLLFVAIFIGFTIMDTHHYQQNFSLPGPGRIP